MSHEQPHLTHMDMVATQHALHDVAAHYFALPEDNQADTVPHRTLKNLVAVFRVPYDVKPVVKSRLTRGLMAHDFPSWALKPHRPMRASKSRSKDHHQIR